MPWFSNKCNKKNIKKNRTLGFYGPLVLAPAEGLGALQAPCQVGVILSLYFCLFVYFVLYFLSFVLSFLSLLPFCLLAFLPFLSFCLFVFLKWVPNPKICSERSWLPIFKMVWHFTICSVVWVLELCEVQTCLFRIYGCFSTPSGYKIQSSHWSVGHLIGCKSLFFLIVS